MLQKDIVAVAVTVIVLVFGYLVYEKGGTEDKVEYPRVQQSAKITADVQENSSFFIGKTLVSVVTYTDKGFSPATVAIPKDSAIIFRNYSSKSMRVASGPHPSHEGYPDKNGCAGSAFDSCANIPPNVSWSFIFNSTGSWNYHNHLNAGQSGIIMVK